jgi:sec-independent protein translocase protein TatA
VIESPLFPRHSPSPRLRRSRLRSLEDRDLGVIMFGSIGIPELIIILVIILLLFGASRLPEIGRGLGKGIKNFKESTRESSKDD